MKIKNIGRIIVATLIGSLSMLGLSYLWHGIILNDFSSLQYDLNLFFWLLSVLYLFVSFGMSLLLFHYRPEEHRIFKHFSIGLFIGFLMYLTAFVLGVSFSGTALKHVILDFCWQMLEQGVGAFVISCYYIVMVKIDKVKEIRSYDY